MKQGYGGPELATFPYLPTPPGAPIVPPLDIAKVVKMAFTYGNSLGIFANYIVGGPLTPEVNVINMDTGRFTLDRYSLLNESRLESREAYVRYGAEVAVLLANKLDPTANREVTQADAEAAVSEDFGVWSGTCYGTVLKRPPPPNTLCRVKPYEFRVSTFIECEMQYKKYNDWIQLESSFSYTRA